MSSLSPKARALLARTASKHDPTDADVARVRHKLASRIVVATAATGATTALASSKSAATPAVVGSAGASGGGAIAGGAGVAGKVSIGFGAKLLASLVLVGSAGAALLAISHDESTARVATSASKAPGGPRAAPPDPSRSSAVAPAPLAIEPPAIAEPPARSPAEEPGTAKIVSARVGPPPSLAPAEMSRPLPRAASSAMPHATGGAREDDLMAEVALLRDVQTFLREHDGARALEAIDAHAQRFPHGSMTLERQAARVFALCELGRVREANVAKAKFLADHPQSPEAERVRNCCSSRW